MQERTITLPLAGETPLLVIRETPETSRAIDTIEAIVRQTEDFMDVAFPFKVLPVIISDTTGSHFGRNYQESQHAYIHIGEASEHQFFVIAHEVAHSYWHSPLAVWRIPPAIDGVRLSTFGWIFEGAATFMQNRAEDRLDEYSFEPQPGGCGYFQSIEEMDQTVFSDVDEGLRDKVRGCDYSMGSSLFGSLYHALGDEEFRRGFGDLYLKISNLEHEDECIGAETGICYLRKAFVQEASPGFAEPAAGLINLLYEEDGLRTPGWREIRGVMSRSDSTPGLEDGGWIQVTAYEVGASEGTAMRRIFMWHDMYSANFRLYVPDGNYSLFLENSTEGEGRNYGWYDGEGVTLDRSMAVEIVVDGSDVEGVEIRLSNEL